jgi:hypothetical protein
LVGGDLPLLDPIQQVLEQGGGRLCRRICGTDQDGVP